MTIALPKQCMKVPEFLAWAEAQPQGRYELVNGEVVAMAPERVRRNLVKLAVARALGDAVKRANLPCTVFTDGVGIVINESTVREPDASVQCGGELNLDSMTLDAPLIVVEVASPSSERHDTHAKLVEYFSVQSIRHYLVVLPEQGVVVHYRRNDGGAIDTRIGREGTIDLTPPGMTVPLADLLGPSSAGDVSSNERG
jgi:Uma2 family endonuclease